VGPEIDLDRALMGVAPLIERACAHRRNGAGAQTALPVLDA